MLFLLLITLCGTIISWWLSIQSGNKDMPARRSYIDALLAGQHLTFWQNRRFLRDQLYHQAYDPNTFSMKLSQDRHSGACHILKGYDRHCDLAITTGIKDPSGKRLASTALKAGQISRACFQSSRSLLHSADNSKHTIDPASLSPMMPWADIEDGIHFDVKAFPPLQCPSLSQPVAAAPSSLASSKQVPKLSSSNALAIGQQSVAGYKSIMEKLGSLEQTISMLQDQVALVVSMAGSTFVCDAPTQTDSSAAETASTETVSSVSTHLPPAAIQEIAAALAPSLRPLLHAAASSAAAAASSAASDVIRQLRDEVDTEVNSMSAEVKSMRDTKPTTATAIIGNAGTSAYSATTRADVKSMLAAKPATAAAKEVRLEVRFAEVLQSQQSFEIPEGANLHKYQTKVKAAVLQQQNTQKTAVETDNSQKTGSACKKKPCKQDVSVHDDDDWFTSAELDRYESYIAQGFSRADATRSAKTQSEQESFSFHGDSKSEGTDASAKTIDATTRQPIATITSSLPTPTRSRNAVTFADSVQDQQEVSHAIIVQEYKGRANAVDADYPEMRVLEILDNIDAVGDALLDCCLCVPHFKAEAPKAIDQLAPYRNMLPEDPDWPVMLKVTKHGLRFVDEHYFPDFDDICAAAEYYDAMHAKLRGTQSQKHSSSSCGFEAFCEVFGDLGSQVDLYDTFFHASAGSNLFAPPVC